MRRFIMFLSLLFCRCLGWAETPPQIRDVFDAQSHRLIAKLSYCDSGVKARVLYYYNERGQLIESIVDDGTSEDLVSLQGVTERLVTQYTHSPHAIDEEHPEEIIEKLFNYNTGEETLIKRVINTYLNGIQLIKRIVMDGRGNAIETTFEENGHITSLLEKTADGTTQLTSFNWNQEGRLEQTSQERLSSPTPSVTKSENELAIEASRAYFQKLYSSLRDLLNRLHSSSEQTQPESEQSHDFESIAEYMLGADLFAETGYYVHPATQGIYGQGEIHPKVRISAINGLFNTPDDRVFTLKLLSKLHGGCNIHYIARPFEAWSNEMFSATWALMGFYSHQSYTLALLWKKLIAELGGVNGGGTIIHYAHSAGGSDTYNARHLMTSEELKMIRVYTFGSPTMIPNGQYQSVVNYCGRDPIGWLGVLLDPIAIIKSFFDSNSNIVFLPGYLPYHQWSSQDYVATLEKLGAEFVETYIKARDQSPAFVID